MVEIKVKTNSGVQLPKYETNGAVGLDIRANQYSYCNEASINCDFPDDGVIIRPMDRILIKTGLFLEIPEGYEAQVRPRSGLALKYGITIVNSPGTIDSDYRGEIGVILLNTGNKPFTINKGDRIAQLVFNKIERINLINTDELSITKRGSGGYNSTGVK